MIKIRIIIDYDRVNSIKQLIIKKLILNRAYKGYVWWVKEEKETPLSFSEFSCFEFWKIELSFRIYFNRFRNGLFSKNYINFKSIVLDKP